MGGNQHTVSELLDLSRTLVEPASLDEGLRAITECALRLVPADHASVRLCRESDPELVVGARAGRASDRPPPPFRMGEGVMGWAAEHGELVCVPEAGDDPRFRQRGDRGFEVRSLLSVPLSAEGRVLGVFSVSAPEPAAFGEDERMLSELLAGCATQALRIASLQHLAITDPLTLAFNRSYLLPRLREEVARAARSSTPLSVLLLDLDHFKRVNDEHGHAVGDAALRVFTDTVRECVRSIDLLVRRGGEEFVLVMPATTARQAFRVAERIRCTLAGRPLRTRKSTLWQTVSIGAATWDRAETAEQLEDRADRAMYAAKRSGRNRVVVAEGPRPA